MDIILSSVKWQSAIIYLEDIAVFSKIIHSYLTSLQLVLTLEQCAGIPLKLEYTSSS